MKAEIIAVGTEILLGQITNTNATFLSEQLASLGIDVYFHAVVGDNQQRLEAMLSIADTRSDIIVLCGGLGPTEDDLTKEAVANHVGEKLVEDAPAMEQVLQYHVVSQRPMAENNRKQGMIIEHGIPMPNPAGLAVGCFYQSADKTYILLPGPPAELKAMFLQETAPLLQSHFPVSEMLTSRVMRFIGIGESQLVTDIADILSEQTNPTVAPYAKTSEVTLRLTAKSENGTTAAVLLDEVEERIMRRVGQYFYGYGEENTIENEVVSLLKAHQRSVTCAESLTAGLCQSTLAKVPGVSNVFKGGFVTYSAETKQQFLGIPAELIAEYGTVSPECAEAMAVYARNKLKTDYALAFTGVAGPDELEGQPAGTVWIGIAGPNGSYARRMIASRDREYIRISAVKYGLNFLRQQLLIDHQK